MPPTPGHCVNICICWAGSLWTGVSHFVVHLHIMKPCCWDECLWCHILFCFCMWGRRTLNKGRFLPFQHKLSPCQHVQRGLYAAANAFIITSVKISQHESSLFKHTLSFIHFISHPGTNWKYNVSHSQRLCYDARSIFLLDQNLLYLHPVVSLHLFIFTSCLFISKAFSCSTEFRPEPLEPETNTCLRMRSTFFSKIGQSDKKGTNMMSFLSPLRVMMMMMKKQDIFCQVSSP